MLSRESALELVEASANSKGLAILVLPCVGAEGDGTITSFIVGHMVYARAGGFLLIFPAGDEVREAWSLQMVQKVQQFKSAKWRWKLLEADILAAFKPC